jgi:hypothetical protein
MDLTNEWADGDDYAYYNQGSSDDRRMFVRNILGRKHKICDYDGVYDLELIVVDFVD